MSPTDVVLGLAVVAAVVVAFCDWLDTAPIDPPWADSDDDPFY